MIALLDTDVLIDCLRGTPAARSWLSSNAAQSFQVPGIAAMELLMGCNNQADLERIQQFLSTFSIT
ncbi:MAG: hypothetical protein NZM11_01680 [Anaerolineales bacterium]|nr:hypothetical protein [Anaerolineales bacterium]